MKKLMVVTLALLFVCGTAAFADDHAVTGEVLDMNCYGNGQSGEGHATCATRCLGNGSPMGLLVDGEVVLVDREGSDADTIKQLEGLGGKIVTVEGASEEVDGKVTIKVTSAKAG